MSDQKELQRELQMTKREVYVMKAEMIELRIKLDELIDYCKKLIFKEDKR